MLVLTSNGLSSPEIRGALASVLTKFKTAVIVTTASVGYKENDRHIPRLKQELQSFGLSVDFFDFDTQNPNLLLQYDVVEINGGNPFYLLQAMKKADCSEILHKISKEKMLIGISAGSLVLQKDICLVAQYSPEMNETVHLMDLRGFALTDVEILPHYSRFIHQFNRFEERAREHEEKTNHVVIRLEDGQGVLIKGNRFEILALEDKK